MIRILILDTITFGDDINISKLSQLGEVRQFEQSSAEEAMERLKTYNPDVVVVNKVILDEQVMSQAPNLKMIAETATGYNNIDLEYAKKRGIAVANVAGYSTQSVIQHTFALCLYLFEKLAYYDDYVKSGEYEKSPSFTHFSKVFHELHGKTWGIIGLGSIGRGVADVAKAFGCRVIYYSASNRSYDTEYERVEFDELLSCSDVISIHAPLNEHTQDLMDYQAFGKMKRSAILLNLGRGPIVNDTDLTRALEENLIAGAGLDVIANEPITADNPLNLIKDKSKLIITPHNAWATFEARTRLMEEVYLNIEAFLEGKKRNRIC